MGKVKAYKMDIEDAVWQAMEIGAKTKEDIYSFVVQRLGTVPRGVVNSVIEEINETLDSF